MRSNPLLKWLLIPLAALALIVGIRLVSAERGNASSSGALASLTPEEMKALGIEGDTPRDTVATLVAQVKQLRGKLKTTLSGNKEQKAENERLRAREATIEQRVRNALEGEQNRLRQERAGSHHIDRTLLDARQGLRRPLTEADIHSLPAVNAAYTRTAANEIHRQFRRLPNPDMTLYVFAHLAGSDPVPIPGYTTVFPFYRRVQYALPGERVEDY